MTADATRDLRYAASERNAAVFRADAAETEVERLTVLLEQAQAREQRVRDAVHDLPRDAARIVLVALRGWPVNGDKP